MKMYFPFRERPRELDAESRRKLRRSPGVWQPLIRMGIMLLVLFALLVGLVVFGALSSDGDPGDERSAFGRPALVVGVRSD
ncbi:MAG: hypothetical protein HOH95_11435 [Dehalococcoidia bacterium]|jgi:hypothetical protein|nr:hypothetical protein [Dehalococcoidia bacterium]